MSRLVLSVAKPNTIVVEVADAGRIKPEGEQPGPLGFAVLSPAYGHNRPDGRSIRLLAVTRSHRLYPVEYSQRCSAT
jgi:hypothetical protein